MNKKITISLFFTFFSSIAFFTNQEIKEQTILSENKYSKAKNAVFVKSQALTHKQFQALLNPNSPATEVFEENLETLENYSPKNKKPIYSMKEFKRKYEQVEPLPHLAETHFGIIDKIQKPDGPPEVIKRRYFLKESNFKEEEISQEEIAIRKEKYQNSKACINHERIFLNELDHQNIIPLLASIEKKSLEETPTPINSEYLQDEYVIEIIIEPLIPKKSHPIGIIIPWYPTDLLQLLIFESEQFKKTGFFNVTPPTILKIALDVAEGIKYSHSKNILHKDIKAENIFLDRSIEEILETKEVNAVLADFGLAEKNISNYFRGSQGTPEYVAPEVIESKSYSYPADIFSYGILLYILSEIFPPFTKNSYESLPGFVRRIHRSKLRGPETYLFFEENPIFPEGNPLEEMIILCTQPCPEDRPSIDIIIDFIQKKLEEL